MRATTVVRASPSLRARMAAGSRALAESRLSSCRSMASSRSFMRWAQGGKESADGTGAGMPASMRVDRRQGGTCGLAVGFRRYPAMIDAAVELEAGDCFVRGVEDAVAAGGVQPVVIGKAEAAQVDVAVVEHGVHEAADVGLVGEMRELAQLLHFVEGAVAADEQHAEFALLVGLRLRRGRRLAGPRVFVVEMGAGLAHGGQHLLPVLLVQRQAGHHIEQTLPAQLAGLGAAGIAGPRGGRVQSG
ncbi:hypothetical protein G6F65_019601 [Rhizopus arrhizus]|nr:hypothetical protein G6F65_019601 [Rhizopus arrhizus]